MDFESHSKELSAENTKTFKYLDDLIHSGVKEIVLDSDIVLDDDEESDYEDGINLNVPNLIIDGNGHTIDANVKARIFYCTRYITVKNITLKNGYSKDHGGAIYNNTWGELTIVESIIKENTANYGGAISNYGKLTIIESIIKENTAEVGGAISNHVGQAIAKKSKLTITESKIKENTAEAGGAIYNDCDLTIIESTLNDNHATGTGGGIYNVSRLTIIKSTLKGNTVEYDASALTASAYCGGAICNFLGGELTIFKSTLKSNTAYDGGAISNDCELTIIESTLNDNLVAGSGGAIYNFEELTIIGSSFNDNIGEAIYLREHGECTISNSTFDGKTVQKHKQFKDGRIVTDDDIGNSSIIRTCY